MREYVNQTIAQQVCTAITCDRCGKRIASDNSVEWHEAFRIEFMAGYGSVFGDGNRVECDLCQTCLQTLIGKLAHVTSEDERQEQAPV